MEKIALDPLLGVIPMQMIPTGDESMILDILDLTREQINVMVEKETLTYFNSTISSSPGPGPIESNRPPLETFLSSSSSASTHTPAKGAGAVISSSSRPLVLHNIAEQTDKNSAVGAPGVLVADSMMLSSNGSCCCRQAGQEVLDPATTTREKKELDSVYHLRMSDWSHRIVDFFGVSREIVAISFDYLNRFIASNVFPCDTAFAYKLASITALYIALKVHNRKTLKPSTLANLSKGEITVNDIVAMETLMLKALSFHLCPPTSYAFIRAFYAFVPAAMKERIGSHLMHQAIYMAELAVMDIAFRDTRPSLIAFGAMLNAIDRLDTEIPTPPFERAAFVEEIKKCLLELKSSSSSVMPAAFLNGAEADFWSRVDQAREHLGLVLRRACGTNGMDVDRAMVTDVVLRSVCDHKSKGLLDENYAEEECRDDISTVD